MRAVIQRVSRAEVRVDGRVVGAIRSGLLILLGIERGDGERDLEYFTEKIRGLRVFADDAGRMNRSIAEVGGSLLIVSQFTLLGDCARGNRPSFDRAERPETAKAIYDRALERFRATGIPTEAGVFGAMMLVELVNDGPVTLVLDSRAANSA
jgi:D-tyrosyl-tRNA(Tyr) deacylase